MRPDTPTCWGWPIPVDLVESTKATHRAYWARLGPEEHAELVLSEWQAERCAVCSRVGRLVTDHDHHTGRVRGLLCRSCNVTEGMRRRDGGVFDRYREKSPAAILGIISRYWDPLAKDYAPDHTGETHDRWTDNPMRGIGL